ncbi:MAG: hypothetical protein ACTSX1_05160, partial [Candidatus Heimdallarchaeaceae archaeon]
MEESIDIRVKFIVMPEDIDDLQKAANEVDLKEFKERFDRVFNENGSTFQRFIDDRNKEILETANVFDAAFRPESNAGKLFSRLLELPNISISTSGPLSAGISINPKQAFDIKELTGRVLEDIRDAIFNTSVVTDAVASDPPRPQPSRPGIPSSVLELNELLTLRPGEQIFNSDEILEIIKQDFQSQLDILAGSEELEVPELKIKVAKVTSNIDQSDSGNIFDVSSLSNSIQNDLSFQETSIGNLQSGIIDLKEQYIEARRSILAQKGATDEVTASQIEQAAATGDLTSKLEQVKTTTTGLTNEGVMPLKENLDQAKVKVEQTEKSLDGLGGAALGANKDTKKLGKQVEDATDQIGDFNDESSDVDLKNAFAGVPKEIIKPEAVEQIKSVGPELVKSAETGKKGLSSLGVFAGNIATNIANSFSNFISTAIKGDFDGIEGLWDNLLDSLQDTFADFAAGLLTNPIRLVFESTIDGKEGGLGDLLKGLFGGGKKDEKSTTPPTTPDPGTDVENLTTQANETIENTVDAGFLDKISGVLGTIGQVVGIVGAIAGLVLSLVNVISGLTKKKPRLDVDLDKLRDEFGKSTGQAAKVLDFL